MSIRRLLVANRGEIALRIIRACRELRIETVAVCSSIDEQAPHARAADRSVTIGPPHPRDSYLSIGAVIDAARATGADAVHPGYGFLSESPEMAAYRAALAADKAVCTDIEAQLDATAERGVLGCEGYPEHPEDLYRPPPTSTP